ncbi:MAG TPA: VOC family protein [Allosphingosinicella sp.]|nr:VOC family protein [Allosphingosinicella sp.]
MPRMIFVNLPVTDLERSIGFYRALGAEQNMQFSDETAAMMSFTPEINVMILTHDKYRQFTSKPVADAHATSQVLLCLSGESRADIDATVERAAAAGGRADPAPIQDYGWMYGRSFEDPDGHHWEVAWMDMEALGNQHAVDASPPAQAEG